MSIGTIIGTVAKTVTSPKAKMAIDVIFYTSSALMRLRRRQMRKLKR